MTGSLPTGRRCHDGAMRPLLLALRRASVPTALLLAAGVTLAPSAAAHNPPPSPDPADGATVATAPAEVVLTFTDVVLDVGAAIAVTGPDGTDLSDGPPVVDDTVVTQPLRPERPAGDYQIDWRVTSADGHPVDGTFTFTATDAVGVAEEPSAPATPAPSKATTTAPAPSETTEPPATTAPADDERSTDASGTRKVALIIGIVGLLVFIPLLVRRLRDTRQR